jgi:hypothetical protein
MARGFLATGGEALDMDDHLDQIYQIIGAKAG